MKRVLTVSLLALMLILSSCAAAEAPAVQTSAEPSVTPTVTSGITPADDELVAVKDYIPSIQVDLKYAGTDNFTGQVIYDFTDAQLRYGTVKKLARVQQELSSQGFCLMIWDAYRPVSAQFALWHVCPDPAFVADPNRGYSNHSRGNTLDVTLIKADGTALPMPTDFDDFSALADRDYSDVTGDALENVQILEQAMTDGGFTGYSGEWWHFSDTTEYPIIEE